MIKMEQSSLIHYLQESGLITIYEKLSKDPLKSILPGSYTWILLKQVKWNDLLHGLYLWKMLCLLSIKKKDKKISKSPEVFYKKRRS